MRAPFTQLFVHLVWATWNRLPLIRPEFESRLYSAVIAKCESLQCKAIAVNGMADHVHVLVWIPTTIAVGDLVKNIKGSTSHLINHEIDPEGAFKWQGADGAFSVSRTAVDRVAEYVRDQKRHHTSQNCISDLEQCEELE